MAVVNKKIIAIKNKLKKYYQYMGWGSIDKDRQDYVYYEMAAKMAKKYKMGRNFILEAAEKAFAASMKKGNYMSAINIAIEYAVFDNHIVLNYPQQKAEMISRHQIVLIQ